MVRTMRCHTLPITMHDKMAPATKWRLLFAFLAISVTDGEASKELIVKMSKGFSSAFAECSQQLNIQDHIMEDFQNFWREEYDLVNKELGCMFACMARKHDLMTDTYSMHHDKTHEFAKSHGADDDTAKQLVTIIHECEKDNTDEEDHCVRMLSAAKCFRTKMHELKWAPSLEDFLEELTEV